ncbi:MAG: fructose-bisphosphate aldolase class I [Rhodospirillales bacterium]|nr:MAG: fructose-bisphosphate aldolase class I [Rhodospirillales bacterium]
MTWAEMEETAQALVAEGRGILAADESTGTIAKRLASIGVESTFDTRRAYRELLFAAPGLGRYVSGVILYDETIRQHAADGAPLTEILRRQHIVPGIKVDTGAKPLAFCPDETVTEGLDGLRERLVDYRALGARFAKWRAVIRIGAEMPTTTCIAANAHALARYAALCQEGGIVPIVEPEVLMDGSHDIDTCETVTTEVLQRVFDQLHAHRVVLEAMLLKPNMVVAGRDCDYQADVNEVAERTLHCLRRTVPSAVPGIVFLSGGQTSEQATAHLNAMNAGFGPHPWTLSFSYGRALQDQALKAWRGSSDNAEAAQQILVRRSMLNSAACRGAYTGEAA